MEVGCKSDTQTQLIGTDQLTDCVDGMCMATRGCHSTRSSTKTCCNHSLSFSLSSVRVCLDCDAISSLECMQPSFKLCGSFHSLQCRLCLHSFVAFSHSAAHCRQLQSLDDHHVGADLQQRHLVQWFAGNHTQVITQSVIMYYRFDSSLLFIHLLLQFSLPLLPIWFHYHEI